MSNTIKLATFDRRDEIAIMKMVGATNSFIRWPFIFQGFILGINRRAGTAFIAQWLHLYAFNGHAAGKLHHQLYYDDPVFQSVAIPIFGDIRGAWVSA